jgi:hypothetical protein
MDQVASWYSREQGLSQEYDVVGVRWKRYCGYCTYMFIGKLNFLRNNIIY